MPDDSCRSQCAPRASSKEKPRAFVGVKGELARADDDNDDDHSGTILNLSTPSLVEDASVCEHSRGWHRASLILWSCGGGIDTDRRNNRRLHLGPIIPAIQLIRTSQPLPFLLSHSCPFRHSPSHALHARPQAPLYNETWRLSPHL